MQRSGFYFSIFITITISALMLYFTGLIPTFGEWYSYDQSLRLQTQAFMRGELALRPLPYGHRYDWAWGNGIQQLWGLGVPLIQLPFELIARLFGFLGFPDRIIFFFFYVLVAIIFWKSLDSTITSNINNIARLRERMKLTPILLFAFLNPAFITMMRARFQPYEEVTAYGYLWALMLFALTHLFINNRRSYIYLLICLLAGFSPNIRPTIGAYGAVSFLIVFYLAYRSRIKFRWVGLPVFMAGIIFLLATNYLRFGSPLEFGHRLILDGDPPVDYLLKFDNPLNWLPFSSVALELLSALFFIDLHKINVLKEGLLWQTDVLRLREFNFKPFDSLTLTFLLLAWVVIAVVWLQNRKSSSSSNVERKGIIKWGGLWSICSFTMLFYFYSRTPALASRYLVDFGPAIVVGISVLYFYASNFIKDRLPQRLAFISSIALCILFSGWVFVGLSQARIAPLYQYLQEIEITNVATVEVAQKKLVQMRQAKGLPLPAIYRCGDQESTYGIPSNNTGWEISKDCRISIVTTHFLDSPACLAIRLEPADLLPESYSDEEIRVRVGLETWDRVSDIPIDHGKVVTYCSNEGKIYELGNQPAIELVSIAWSDLRKHPNKVSLPIKLISLEKER